VCYVAMCCEADFEDIAEAAHLKRFEATDLCDTACPAFKLTYKHTQAHPEIWISCDLNLLPFIRRYHVCMC